MGEFSRGVPSQRPTLQILILGRFMLSDQSLAVNVLTAYLICLEMFGSLLAAPCKITRIILRTILRAYPKTPFG